MTGWAAVLLHDGVQVAGPVPCDDYDAASILAPLVVGWLGGPVSVAKAVAATRAEAEVDGQLSIDDELAA